MEIKRSYLTDYIKVIDNVMPQATLDVLLRVCKGRKEFQDGTVIGGKKNLNQLNKKVRDTKIWHPRNIGGGVTEAHWTSFLIYKFNKCLNDYKESVQTRDDAAVKELQILKYTPGGHYKKHTDHSGVTPRTFSLIYFLNDDFDGGEFMFIDPITGLEMQMDKLKNRMLIWPSNFMYPHLVKPVTKGIRYSVVSWAL
tara:strand:+ start:1936 stop:2523 length:588 start_codon:yes stop_codon:yes gene_type:complete